MAFELKKVLISDEVDAKCIEVLLSNGIHVDKKTKLTKEQLLNEIKEYDGLIVRSATKVTKDVLNAGSRLKIVGRAGTGVDNIDCEAATRKGVIVMNTPGGNTISAAEHTCALICALSRNVAAGDASMKAGRWDRKKFMGNELYGKTLAIVGLGQIGKQVALRMQSFGMTTIGFDPIIPKEAAAEFGVTSYSLEEIWPQADYITVHVPLIPGKTANLINSNVIASCKPGVRILNVARGGIVNEKALLEGIKSGHVGGAALDVFCEEPPTGSSLELAKHDNVIATPHLGASTVEAQTRVAVEIAQQFADLAAGKTLYGAINAQALANTLQPSCQPWIALAKVLGALIYKLASADIKGAATLKLMAFGEELKKANYLLNATLVGMLHAGTPNGFNMVNAPMYAKEKLINAEFVHGGAMHTTWKGIDSGLSLEVKGEGKTFTVVGTVSIAGPLLLRINEAVFASGCPINGPNLLVYKAAPQLVSTVMSTLTSKGVMVESFCSSQPLADANTWAAMKINGPIKADITIPNVVFSTTLEV